VRPLVAGLSFRAPGPCVSRHSLQYSETEGEWRAQTITSAGYVGWQEVTLTLVPGRWSFFAPGGQRAVFVVLA